MCPVTAATPQRAEPVCRWCGQEPAYPGLWGYLRLNIPLALCATCLEILRSEQEAEMASLEDVA